MFHLYLSRVQATIRTKLKKAAPTCVIRFHVTDIDALQGAKTPSTARLRILGLDVP
jgi:hypothetical protein